MPPGSGQGFCLVVPNTNSSITAGAGASEGICLTSDMNHFLHAGAEVIIEAASDMRLCTTGTWGAAASCGVLIGTPATIQASAGGGVQIYAGAGISPSIGSPNGPGAPFSASAPASTGGAGGTADKLNAFNDFVSGAASVASGISSFKSATGTGKVSAAISTAAGAWSALKGASGLVSPVKSPGTDFLLGSAGLVGKSLEIMAASDKGDSVGVGTGIADFGAGFAGLVRGTQVAANNEANKAKYDAALAEAQAAAAARGANGSAGGSLGPPADGPRIHEVAPLNIDRECGASMTAKVGGDKTASVDGDITYKSGSNITMKAFNKVSTSSLVFSAHANISATMKGLVSAKVDSMVTATVSGKVKFVVTTGASGQIKAPAKLDVETAKFTLKAGQTKIGPGKVDIGPGPVTIDSVTKINKNTEIKGTLQVAKKTEIKGPLFVNNKIQAKQEIKGNSTLKNKYFQAG